MNPGGLGYGARKASQLDKEGSEKDDSGDGIAVRVRLGNAPGSTVARWTHTAELENVDGNSDGDDELTKYPGQRPSAWAMPSLFG
jgi:hypothetical protein